MEFPKDIESAAEFLNQPIPDLDLRLKQAFDKKTWKDIPVIEESSPNPKKLAIIPNTPIRGKASAWPAYYKMRATDNPNNTPSGFGELAQSVTQDLQNSPLVKVRPDCLVMLDRAQELLDATPETSHLQLVVVDAYRELDTQDALFKAYCAYLQEEHPDLDQAAIEDLAQKMVSIPPRDNETLKSAPPPHATGGAVDVILVDKSKVNITDDDWLQNAMIDFGADFDEMMHPDFQDERSATRFFENKDSPACKNRRLLFHLMNEVGFTNYHAEWWHFDYGNQFDALRKGLPDAKYGFAAGVTDGKVVEDKSAEKAAYQRYLAQTGTRGDAAELFAGHFGLQDAA